MSSDSWKEKLKIYDETIGLHPELERKGVTMPHTSANGRMFTQLNKSGEIGIRLSDDKRQEFIKK